MTGLTDTMRRVSREYWEDSGRLSALALLLIGVVTIALGMNDLWQEAPWRATSPTWWHLGPLLIGCAATLLRRTRPAVSLSVALAMLVVDLMIGGSLAVAIVLFDALYAAERFGHAALRRAVRFGAGVVTVAAVIGSIRTGISVRDVMATGLQVAALLLLPVWWGLDVRRRSELAEAAQARADLETARANDQARAQDAERARAIQAERSRMARELHDAVAGDVSALVIHAGAALSGPPGPQDREALHSIRDSGLHALGELRTMIGVLTADGEGEPVAPTLTADGAALLDRFDTEPIDGTRPDQLQPLPDQTDRAGYRVLQEALTNAARHGSGAARVRLTRDQGMLELVVSNAVGHRTADSSGIGLASMTERAHAVGGVLTTQEEGGTWTMTARLPLS